MLCGLRIADVGFTFFLTRMKAGHKKEGQRWTTSASEPL